MRRQVPFEAEGRIWSLSAINNETVSTLIRRECYDCASCRDHSWHGLTDRDYH